MIKFPMKDAPRDGRGVELLVQYNDTAEGGPLLEQKVAWTIGCNQFDKTGIDEWVFVGWDWDTKNFTQGKGTPIGWRYCGLNEIVDKSKLKDFSLTNASIEQNIKNVVLPRLYKDVDEWDKARLKSIADGNFKAATSCGDAATQCRISISTIEDLINKVAELESKLQKAGVKIEG